MVCFTIWVLQWHLRSAQLHQGNLRQKEYFSFKETWNGGSIFHSNTLRLLFCVPSVVHLYEFQISNFSKHIPVDSIKFEFVSKEKVNFNEFLWQAIFKIFQMWNKIWEIKGNISLSFLFRNICLQSTLHLLPLPTTEQ